MTTRRGPLHSWVEQMRETAQALPYPPTPDIARSVTARLRDQHSRQNSSAPAPSSRLRIALVVVALFVVSLLAVPDVRATLANWLRLGAVEIVFPTATPQNGPTATPLASVLDLGRTCPDLGG